MMVDVVFKCFDKINEYLFHDIVDIDDKILCTIEKKRQRICRSKIMYSVDDIDAFMTIMVIIDDNTFLVVDSNYLEIIIP
nr:MAG TPA: hypothetical protein [Herelleviridae sp. ctUqP11]